MKLIKGKKIKRPTNIYRFVIDFMIGDADGSSQETVDVKANNKELLEFVQFLESCEGYDGYSERPVGYDRFIDGAENCTGNPCFCWGQEPYSGEPSCFDGYTVTYFDENGIEYSVEVK